MALYLACDMLAIARVDNIAISVATRTISIKVKPDSDSLPVFLLSSACILNNLIFLTYP
jgi:hypothetical protein